MNERTRPQNAEVYTKTEQNTHTHTYTYASICVSADVPGAAAKGWGGGGGSAAFATVNATARFGRGVYYRVGLRPIMMLLRKEQRKIQNA